MQTLPVRHFLQQAAFLAFALLISACQSQAVLPAVSDSAAGPANTPAPAVTAPTPTSLPSPAAAQTSTPVPVSIWISENLPAGLATAVQIPPGIQPAESPGEASLEFDLIAKDEIHSAGVVPWVYALAAPFPTLADEIQLDVLMETWTNSPLPGSPLQSILVDPSTLALFEKYWGKPSQAVKSLPDSRLLDQAWNQPGAWAIIPFEQLQPRWKVIAVNGQSPVRKDFQPSEYGLTLYFGFTGDPALAAQAATALPASNREPDKLTTVVMTGVTALVRGTAALMEGRGMLYPAQDTGDWLRDADILHISNEVPFARNCPQPFDWVELVFCSQTEYIQLLEDIGTDVVELTGDHFKDWGPEAMLYTLELYKERGWKYYGGGANAAEASQPAVFEHNGNRIAFTGCNAKEPGYAGADATSPGAVHCDFDEMDARISRLAAEGYQPIVTFQHLEYYQYVAHPILQADFQRVAKAGAVIVSGSQAHQPHAFEFLPGSLLHYGLGNLFFDQTNQGDPPRTAFIDRHVFYGGRHISTELLTIYLVDYARSRPMTAEERAALLNTVFHASGWETGEPLK